jgi:4-hydroxyproline epimerase
MDAARRTLHHNRVVRELRYHAVMGISPHLHVIDSHTAGEPTRVVISGGPDLGNGSLEELLNRLRTHFDGFRSGVVCEPRGSEVVVGALLLEPVAPDASAAVIFFNDVGYLGMCGHGTIGVVTTLAHLGRIGPGMHKLETPVGDVSTYLHDDGSVTVYNVPSFRHRAAVQVDVPGYGLFVGDIAWGGNWFFLVGEHPYELTLENRAKLIEVTTAIRRALQVQGIGGPKGELIDHIEFFSPPMNSENSSRNFVLCPGASFDRSPCGTGTSAKMACLHAEGKLAAGHVWRQEGILGTVFEGSIEDCNDGRVRPAIRGKAWITGESTLLFTADDPFRDGIRF